MEVEEEELVEPRLVGALVGARLSPLLHNGSFADWTEALGSAKRARLNNTNPDLERGAGEVSKIVPPVEGGYEPNAMGRSPGRSQLMTHLEIRRPGAVRNVAALKGSLARVRLLHFGTVILCQACGKRVGRFESSGYD
jgi:hypothetical protein